jgi:hypothetical protein
MAKKFGCYTSITQKNSEPSVTFDTKPEAEKWCDNWNTKMIDPNSLSFAVQIRNRAHIREIDA